ncbi:MAG: hypothetical protein GF384_08605, partial [Elusimicrobia bacterium]|nr:hypothetical protein [Elusimicrobiota bacterium]MBD3412676.1 hypothetical protein [Elusimicrobiota bacterium]
MKTKKLKLMKTISKTLIATAMLCFSALGARAVDFEISSGLQQTQYADQLLQPIGGGQITIRTMENGNPVPINGTAYISVEVQSDPIQDTAVHVNPTLAPGSFPYIVSPPSNAIQIVNGSWTGNIMITKPHNNVDLRIVDYVNNINNTLNQNFDIIPGSLAYLWFELPGEEYTPGYWPGYIENQHTTRTAGDFMGDFKIYAIDRAWNNVSLGQVPDTLTVSAVTANGAAQLDVDPIHPVMPTHGITVFGYPPADYVRVRTADLRYPAVQLTATTDLNNIVGTSNELTMIPGAYDDLVVVAEPLDIVRGGRYENSVLVGRTAGTPNAQRINDPFQVTVYITDEYFNPIDSQGGFNDLELWINGQYIEDIDPNGSTVVHSVTLTQQGSNEIKFLDKTNHSIYDSIDVVGLPGTVEYFEVLGVPDPGTDAGDPFNLTVVARDAGHNIVTDFTGTVELRLYETDELNNRTRVSYDGVMSPVSVDFNNSGVENIVASVFYAGHSMGLGEDRLQIQASIYAPTLKQGFSDEFDIYENQNNFSGIVVILPGQIHTPGGTTWKAHGANPVTAGDPFGVDLYAVDNYGNRIIRGDEVNLSLADPAAFADLGGSFSLVDGYKRQIIRIYTAGTQTVIGTVPAFNFSDSSDIFIQHRLYSEGSGKLLLLAPGETHQPGSETGGKTGTPTPVAAFESLTLTALACDKF